MPATLSRVRGVAQLDNPIAYLRGMWEIVVEGPVRTERWYGPDTLQACLEAQRQIEPLLRYADARVVVRS